MNRVLNDPYVLSAVLERMDQSSLEVVLGVNPVFNEEGQRILYQRYYREMPGGLEQACKLGLLIVVRKLLVGEANWTNTCPNRALSWAVRKGYFKIVEALSSAGIVAECAIESVEEACANGFLNIISCLYNAQLIQFSSQCIVNASSGGHLELVKFIQEREVKHSKSALSAAAGKGHLDIVEFLVCCEYPTEGSLEQAARGNYLNVVKYLLSVGSARPIQQ